MSKPESNHQHHREDSDRHKCSPPGVIEIKGKIEAYPTQDLLAEWRNSTTGSDTRENRREKVEKATLGFVALVALLNLVQTCSSVRSADAARRAADIAKDTLRISQRAYIGAGDPSVLYDPMEMRFQVRNSGHIPTGKVTVITHRAIFFTADPKARSLPFRPVENGWGSSVKRSVMPDSSFEDVSPFRLFDKDQFLAGNQILILAGTLEYNDGFPEDGAQQTNFCFQSQRYAASGEHLIVDCDADEIIAKLTLFDRYPQQGDNQKH